MELKKMSSGPPAEKGIEAEKETVLPGDRTGSYDFYLEFGGRATGIEVLARPSKGKLKEKLRYRENVDSYIFVLPEECLGFYRKEEKRGLASRVRKKSFPKEFSDPGLKAWLLDARGEKFTLKGAFAQIFNVAGK